MKIFAFLALFMLVLCGSVACKKNKGPLRPTSGIYRGVFSRILSNGDTTNTGIVHLAMTEASNSYSLRGDTSSNTPYSCSGIYKVLDGNDIEFTNKAALEPGIMNPYFVLDTIFEYKFLDSTFVLEFENDEIIYRYDLSRF